MTFPYFPIKFDKNAKVIVPGEKALYTFLKDPTSKASDLIVISQGWNNDMAEAENLYSELFNNAAALLQEGKLPSLADRRFTVLGVVALEKVCQTGTDPLQRSRHPQGHESAPARLRDSDSAFEEFVTLARSLVKPGIPDLGEGSDSFFSGPPNKVFQKLTMLVTFTTIPAAGGGSGSAAGLGGSALGVSDLFSGIGSAASNVLNLTTYYQMKVRAGLIGSTALNPILQAIAKEHPALRVHLVGRLDEPPAGSLFPLRLRPELGPEEQRWLLPPRGRPESHPGANSHHPNHQ
jgi:hypothetical protein